MELTPYDKESVTWLKLKAEYTARLHTLRMQNDSKMSEEDRNLLLGQILEVKALLKLGDEPIDMSGL
jgi:hypothetical protein